MNTWLDAQVGVLGSVLVEPELAPRLLAETSASDYSGDCRAVYGAITALVTAGDPVDAMTIRNKLGPASADLLRQIMAATPTAANFTAYIQACKEQSRLEALHRLAAELTASATLDDARGTLAKMQSVTVENNSSRIFTMMDCMTEFFSRGQGPRTYIEWGLPALDDRVFTDRGDVIVLGGYPSDGKSAFAMQAALHMAKSHKVGYFLFEGTQPKTTDGIVAHQTKESLTCIRKRELSQDAWKHIAERAPDISKLPVTLIEASGMTVTDVLGVTLAKGFEVIFLDYVQLIEPSHIHRAGTRQEELAEISRALAIMARQHKIMVVELSQLTRPPKNKDGSSPPPTMSSLRESGQFEQDADVVMLLYRTKSGAQDSPRELFIAKYKLGGLGKIGLHLEGKTLTFYRTTHEEIDRLAARGKRETMAAARAAQTSLDGLDEPTEDNPFAGRPEVVRPSSAAAAAPSPQGEGSDGR